jgi:hypothetical protein
VAPSFSIPVVAGAPESAPVLAVISIVLVVITMTTAAAVVLVVFIVEVVAMVAWPTDAKHLPRTTPSVASRSTIAGR